MPTYEYECRDCGRRFDRVQSFNDEPIRVCPHCGGSTRRVIHASGVIFKGSGWYITDSRKTDSATTGSASASKTAEKYPTGHERRQSARRRRQQSAGDRHLGGQTRRGEQTRRRRGSLKPL